MEGFRGRRVGYSRGMRMRKQVRDSHSRMRLCGQWPSTTCITDDCLMGQQFGHVFEWKECYAVGWPKRESRYGY